MAILSLLDGDEISESNDLSGFLPAEFKSSELKQTDLPRIAKDPRLISMIEEAINYVPTRHLLFRHDSRLLDELPIHQVHLVLTSPPYWTLKEYSQHDGQLGHIDSYEEFLAQLDRVWKQCYDILVPGGRLICVVGDVCLSRRKNGGRHMVMPLHASIQEHCRDIGFDNLAPIIWHKIANAAYEAGGGSTFLGKPYEPNSVIKNDIEFILMQRKSGGYRSPDAATKMLSVISEENHRKWFQQIWTGVTGASTKNHPAPFPLELAERLVRMFSFVGDTVLDPFAGTGTTNFAAAQHGRNSIGVEVDPNYFRQAVERMGQQVHKMFSSASLRTYEEQEQ
jgi:DNA modification methylase